MVQDLRRIQTSDAPETPDSKDVHPVQHQEKVQGNPTQGKAQAGTKEAVAICITRPSAGEELQNHKLRRAHPASIQDSTTESRTSLLRECPAFKGVDPATVSRSYL